MSNPSPNPANRTGKGFQKGNKLWKLGLEARLENKSIQEQFLEKWGTQGLSHYYTMLGKQATGGRLSPDERQFMDRIERWAEFSIAKLSRTELTGKDGGDVGIKINVVNFYDQKKLDK